MSVSVPCQNSGVGNSHGFLLTSFSHHLNEVQRSKPRCLYNVCTIYICCCSNSSSNCSSAVHNADRNEGLVFLMFGHFYHHV